MASTGSRTLVSYRLDLLKDVKFLGSYFELKFDWNFSLGLVKALVFSTFFSVVFLAQLELYRVI